MAYRFKLDESSGKALRRIGLEQLDRALAQLRRAQTGVGVHEARKSIKRSRALLRLVRSAIDDDAFKWLNIAIRDAGRALSAARDQDVLVKTMSQISADTPAARPALRRLVKDLQAQGRAVEELPDARPTARKLLKQAHADWSALALSTDGFAPLAQGIASGVQKLEETFAATDATAGEPPGDEAFHDLRKAVQRYWRQMHLVEAGWPEYFGARWAEAKAISELLGTAQDLTLLLRHLGEHGRPLLKPSEIAHLERIIRKHRDFLWLTARSRCGRLVAESAKAQARHATLFWATATALHQVASAPSTAKSRRPGAKPETVMHAAERVPRPPRKRSPNATLAPTRRPKARR